MSYLDMNHEVDVYLNSIDLPFAIKDLEYIAEDHEFIMSCQELDDEGRNRRMDQIIETTDLLVLITQKVNNLEKPLPWKVSRRMISISQLAGEPYEKINLPMIHEWVKRFTFAVEDENCLEELYSLV